MYLNLSTLFPSFQIFSNKPDHHSHDVFIFKDKTSSNWISINKKEVSTRDYALLTAVFDEFEIPHKSSGDSEQIEWIRYLDGYGSAPIKEVLEIRTLHLSFPNDRWKMDSLREAVEAFFGDEVILLCRTNTLALLIEKKSSYRYGIEDFTSFVAILESDFFMKPKLFVGKFHSSDSEYPAKINAESFYFSKGLNILPTEQIYTMEKVFPYLLIESLSTTMKNTITNEILGPIEQDMEILKTIRYFFESGFNGSITSEKLHIHRNTLNYRLTKFQDITGISVRNFDGALVGYFASLLSVK
ncbi:PucR family transcriptional regulator [Sporosarcina gallistercoris]|uniref:Helix-turn-helix domain-containing protein n=1 Tax=Sporosarcina gallistercoris TaxID=2762245 RepID=A0ABR8PJ89_9BACL|nr:helix-turn-helix domain-containing protein [Sporosarcina gallistercoris]MBD7908223.1 helix-turn-helix domain-containing protein [Sporosarcina gallistercoris]